MMTVLYALWCGFCWILRGGKFGAIVRATLKVEPGTTITRIASSFLMAAPLAVLVDPWLALLWPSIYVAMTIGYFDESMGLEQPGRDHAFLALWGATVLAIALAPVVWLNGPWALAWAALGALAMPVYAANKALGRVRWGIDWTERAEFGTGVVFGAAIYGAALLAA